MKIALISYPMLWQRTGGLQVQVSETLTALRERELAVELFDSLHHRLEEFDVLHVFGAINGNERIVEAACAAGLPVVMSPVVNPPFGRLDAIRARLATAITARLTHWNFTTSYEQIRRAVAGARAIVALGDRERHVLEVGYGVKPECISVVPNGIAARFLQADGTLFREHSGISGPFLLQVSSVNAYKNPLASARVAAALDVPLVLIGQTPGGGEAYLAQCREAAGGRLHYVGALAADSELLASAYAAASVLVLPSHSEVMPLVVLEALAAGTPVVMTRHSSLSLADAGSRVQTIEPTDQRAFEVAVRKALEGRPSEADCRALVAHMTWDAVAERLVNIYEKVLAEA